MCQPKERRRKMGKTIKSVSAKPDDPMFTGVAFISAIQRPILSSELESKKPVKKDKAKRSKKKR
jgi:hypothetical protein